MSEYMLAPGARLEIGPGGKPYESMGACCAGCGPALGATSSPSMTTYLAVAGAGLLGLVVYLRRRKR